MYAEWLKREKSTFHFGNGGAKTVINNISMHREFFDLFS